MAFCVAAAAEEPQAPPPRSVIVEPSSEPRESEPPARPSPPPEEKVAASPASPPEEEEPEDDSTFVYGGIGMAAFGVHPVDRSLRSWDELGFALALGGRHEVHEHITLGGGFTWGLTSWQRTAVVWDTANDLGRWTKNAYVNVTRWVGEGKSENEDEDTRLWRGIAAVYAYVGLLFPYIATGVMYAVGPLFATSHLQLDFTGTFHLLETRNGPYLETGLGFFAYLHPDTDELRGGLGPVVGFGYDVGRIGFGVKSTISPRYLHSEASPDRTDIYTGQFVLKIQ